jgi:hypothetical protein
MLKRSLTMVKRSAREFLGVCDACNARFKSYLPEPEKAEWEIRASFDEHRCKSQDPGQTAARIVKEGTQNRQN